MITKWIVLAHLKQIASLNGAEEGEALPLCQIALEEILIQLREGADKNDIRIASAASCLANYKMTLKAAGNADELESFKAGDVSVKLNNEKSLELAGKALSEAMLALVPLTRDTGFLFRKINL